MEDRASRGAAMRALVSSSRRVVTWRAPGPSDQAAEPPSAGPAGTEGHVPWGQDAPFPVPGRRSLDFIREATRARAASSQWGNGRRFCRKELHPGLDHVRPGRGQGRRPWEEIKTIPRDVLRLAPF